MKILTIRKNFTIEEIAEIDEFFKKKKTEQPKNDRKQESRYLRRNFPKGRARENIAEKSWNK